MNHTTEFLKAVHGECGEFDAWLECNNEDECRAAIISAIECAVEKEREECAKVCEAEHVGNSVEDECDNKGDEGYNMALRHAAASIRAMGNPA